MRLKCLLLRAKLLFVPQTMAEPPVVVVTGCSVGGIGHALAVAFANRNCIVVATSRRISSMAGIDAHPGIEILELDVGSEESRRRAVTEVIEKHGRIDVLVNNAGVHCVAPVVELPGSLLRDTLNTNVYATLSLIQAVVPHMIARRKGKIVNIGSTVAFCPSPWVGGYAASKAALHALTDSLRVELKPFGIQVILVAPGAIKSNIGKNSLAIHGSLPKWRFYEPWEKAILARTTLSQQPSCTANEKFAEKTVGKVMGTNPPACFTYGRYSWFATLLYYLPLRICDYFVAKMFGLNQPKVLKKID